MSITVSISPEARNKLEKRAAQVGQDLRTYVRNLLEKEAAQTLTEAAKPIHRQFDESGMTETELERLIDETVRETRCEKPLSSR